MIQTILIVSLVTWLLYGVMTFIAHSKHHVSQFLFGWLYYSFWFGLVVIGFVGFIASLKR